MSPFDIIHSRINSSLSFNEVSLSCPFEYTNHCPRPILTALHPGTTIRITQHGIKEGHELNLPLHKQHSWTQMSNSGPCHHQHRQAHLSSRFTYTQWAEILRGQGKIWADKRSDWATYRTQIKLSLISWRQCSTVVMFSRKVVVPLIETIASGIRGQSLSLNTLNRSS